MHAGVEPFAENGGPPHGLRSLVLHDGTLMTPETASRVPHLTRLLIGGSGFGLENLQALSSLINLRRLRVEGNFRCGQCFMESHVTALSNLDTLSVSWPEEPEGLNCAVRAQRKEDARNLFWGEI